MRSICSDIVNDMWCIDISPKEYGPDSLYVRLRMLFIPWDQKALRVKFSIRCIELGNIYNFYGGHFSRGMTGRGSDYSLDSLKEFDEVTFKIELEMKLMVPLYHLQDLVSLVIFSPSQIAYLLSA